MVAARGDQQPLGPTNARAATLRDVDPDNVYDNLRMIMDGIAKYESGMPTTDIDFDGTRYCN